MANLRSISVVIILASLALANTVHAGIAGLERVASGLDSPMFVTHAPGDSERLFIVERGTEVDDDPENSTANIRILDLNSGTVQATPFLSIEGLDITGEGGLLGMAFHPDYQSNGQFYVYVTANDAPGGSPFSSYIRQYTVSETDPDVANTNFTPILNWEQPFSNHNGGWIGFNPQASVGEESYLYIMSGDGGSGNDPQNNAQNIVDEKLGKVLRIDVDVDLGDVVGPGGNYALPPSNPFVGVTGDDEIWSYGLRNPFRASFDRETGDLWIGDVGQNAFEEIDFEANGGAGGANYGWRIFEGFNKRLPEEPDPLDYVPPVYDYPRTGTFGGKTVIGGYVYRGPDSDLQGLYFFADSGDFGDAATNKFWTFDSADIPMNPGDPEPTATNIKPLLDPDVGAPAYPVAFGEDVVGNLYIVYLETGDVYRIVTDAGLPGDFNADDMVDGDDFEFWKDHYGTVNPFADGNGDGKVSAADFTVWRDNFGATLGSGAGSGAAIPEPGTLALFGAALGIFAIQRRCLR